MHRLAIEKGRSRYLQVCNSVRFSSSMVSFCFAQRIRVVLIRNHWISAEIVTMLFDKRMNNINERNVILSSTLFCICSVALTIHRVSNRTFFFLKIKLVQRRQTTYVANRINISLKCILHTRGLERIGYICICIRVHLSCSGSSRCFVKVVISVLGSV